MDAIMHASVWGMSTLELVAATLGLVSVGLTIIRNIWCWPIGAVMVALYVWIFWQAKLYADSSLQLVYFVLQFYGWWFWLKGGDARDSAPISRTPPRVLAALAVAGGILSVLAGYLLSTYTDQSMPYADATVTVFSLIAQGLSTRKMLENWPLWIGVDTLAVCIYTAKGLYPTAVLYAVFTIMAAVGWREWRRALVSPTASLAPSKVASL